jgi:chromosome segregation ATPase
MTADDYATLMNFLATRFARMDASFEALNARMARMEERLTGAEVLREGMRDDIRRLVEGLMALNERLDRFEAEMRARLGEHDRRFDSLDRVLGGVQVQFDRFAVDFGTVQLDHGARIEALERWRTGRDSRG